jgi:4-amino-4-deoxy-L-arabinose transferase-like glycosyltransferase
MLLGRLLENAGLILAMLLAFLIVNYIHFSQFTVHVILYACMVDLLIAGAIVLLAHIALRNRRWRTHGIELGLAAVVAVLSIILYSVLGPTVIDRSLSLYIVEKVDQRGGAVAEAAIPALFVEEYMPEYRLVDVRLTEQLYSRTLRLDRDCLRLTPRGRALARAMRFYRAHFLPRRRVLREEVTDQLTHPFQGAPQRVETACPTAETEPTS